jgi:hypothetical protein
MIEGCRGGVVEMVEVRCNVQRHVIPIAERSNGVKPGSVRRAAE